jgi:acyl carrier protein
MGRGRERKTVKAGYTQNAREIPTFDHPVFGGLIMPSQEEIYQKVSATLVEALNVDEDEISPTSTLQGDLGAESIDFLDIVFRLEREFGIKIPRGELFPESIFQGDPEFVKDGKVTEKGLSELRERMPFADLAKFEQNPDVAAISDLFTVDMITKYIQGKLGKN